MALYAIGDLHLSLGTDKSMDVFGGRWTGYVDKLKEGFSVVKPEDTTVLLGDVSWALGLGQAGADFGWIDAIPGKKIILKGNHDYWWSTAQKFHNFCLQHQFTNMELLHNNCHFYEDIAICGTRGWFFEEDREGTHNEKVYKREMLRLEASLKMAEGRTIYCFLHYPPRYRNYQCPEILELLKAYHVERCYYGHLHGDSHKLALEGQFDGTEFALVASDFLKFHPKRIF